MFVFCQMRLTWWELIKRTVKETVADDGLGLAAQLAYYFFLALFPALLFLVALASFFPLQHFTDILVGMLSRFTPAMISQLVGDQLRQLSEDRDAGLLGVGLLGAIWTSSAALVSIISALNRAYDIQEARPWWRARLLAVGLTIVLALFILISFTLVVAGPELADFLGAHLGFPSVFTWTWKILQWPLIFCLVSGGFALVYYYGPDAEQEWVWITPGSLLATLFWLLVSLGFRYYAVNFGNYEKAYRHAGRHHRHPVVVLSHGTGDDCRGRGQCRDRTCLSLGQGSGRKAPR